MYNDVVYLVSHVDSGSVDTYGDPIYTEVRKQVFAEVKSVGRSEFYQASTAGYKPEIIFELADYYDFNNETDVIYNNIKYSILRTYRKGTTIEIVCYGGVR